MIAIESETFNVDSAMALLGGVDSNFVLAGTWNKIPWRVWHHATNLQIHFCRRPGSSNSGITASLSGSSRTGSRTT
jgi:hypothetical protein